MIIRIFLPVMGRREIDRPNRKIIQWRSGKDDVPSVYD
jgi:hypothetical protein